MTIKHPMNVSPKTLAAIAAYRRVVRAEKALARAQRRLDEAAPRIPKHDMGVYLYYTTREDIA